MLLIMFGAGSLRWKLSSEFNSSQHSDQATVLMTGIQFSAEIILCDILLCYTNKGTGAVSQLMLYREIIAVSSDIHT
jgi:hypothetical protein